MRVSAHGLYGGRMSSRFSPLRWCQTHRLWADALLAAVFVTVSVVTGLTVEPSGSEREIGGLGWTLIVFATVPLAVRRTWPLHAMWAILAATVPFWILDYNDDPLGPNLLIAIYSVAAHVERPTSLRHGVAGIAVALGVGTVGVLIPEEDLPWFAIPAFLVMFGTAWVIGDNLRTRRAYTFELELAAGRAQAQQDAEADRAVAEERTRIARELHDVVAHSMSVMVVQAGAARRVLDTDPARARDALTAIESTGRESLDEMRRILGVLRSDNETAELAPTPTLHDFGRLVDQYESAGLPVAVTIEGETADLSPGLELSAYRVVQEGLTNTLKHAGPARAVVRLVYLSDQLEVHVTDDGRGASVAPSGSGQGLVGMRERVEAFGGTLQAGPTVGGGFALCAAFPIGRDR